MTFPGEKTAPACRLVDPTSPSVACCDSGIVRPTSVFSTPMSVSSVAASDDIFGDLEAKSLAFGQALNKFELLAARYTNASARRILGDALKTRIKGADSISGHDGATKKDGGLAWQSWQVSQRRGGLSANSFAWRFSPKVSVIWLSPRITKSLINVQRANV